MPERQIIQIDFSGGTDERTDKRHIVPGKLTSLKNGVFEKGGSIRKRRGYTALSRVTVDGANITSARELSSFRGELVLDTGTTVYGLGQRWATRGALTRAFTSRAPVIYSESLLETPDVAYGNGYLVYAWSQYNSQGGSGTAFVTVVDVATGSQIFSSFQLGTSGQGFTVRTVVLGTKAYVFLADSSKTIRATSLDLTAVTSSAWTALTSVVTNAENASLPVLFDAVALSDRIALVYANDGAAGDTVTVRTFNASLVQLATHSIAGYTATPCTVGVCGATGERIWIVYGDITGGTLTLNITALNDTSLVEGASSLIGSATNVAYARAAICRVDSTHALACWTTIHTVGNGAPVLHYLQVDSSITATGSGILWRHGHISKPFLYNNRCFLMVAHLGDAAVWSTNSLDVYATQGSMVEITLTGTTYDPTNEQSPTEIARIAPNRIGYGPHLDALFSDVVSIGGGKYVALACIKGGTAFGLEAVTFSFAQSTFSRATELGEALFFTGGVSTVYDGAGLVESSFALPANKPYNVSQTTGVGSVANGTYNYVVVFQRHDENGQVYRSEPSDPVEIVVNGANPTFNKVTMQVPCSALHRTGLTSLSAARSVYIKLYRTLAGGTTFYEVDSFFWGDTSAVPNASPCINSIQLESLYVADSSADADIAENSVLYTTGGILPNTAAPSASMQIVHKERLFLAGTDDPKIVWFSKRHVFGEGVSFNGLQTFEVDDGGAITALASLDSHLVVFKRDRIFVVEGDGPPDTGGEGFTEPQRVSSDLGCVEPRSVVLTPDGILFQSPAGIYLLDRALGLAYVSGPVEDTLASYPVITSANVHDSQFHVRFSCTTSDGTEGVVLVFDYLTKQWSVFELYEPVAATPLAAVVSARSYGGNYTWVAANGAPYTESTTSYLDVNEWVTLSFETAWIKLGGLQGWQRAWSMSLLGERFTPHDLTIEVANDYSDTYHQSKTWLDADITTMPLEQIRTALVRQKCQAVRFRISDAPRTGAAAIGSGRGLSFTGIAIEAGLLPKTKRLGAAQRG